MKQTTIKEAIVFKGIGLHTGKLVTMTVKPAECNHWYKFKRVDLPEQPIIEALVSNVVDTSRGTTIGKDGVTVTTIEHLLAALYAMNVDNVLIEIDASETPILDGSAIKYVEAIRNTGVIEQNEERQIVNLHSCEYISPDGKVKISSDISDKSEYEVTIDFGENLPRQQVQLTNLQDFAEKFAKCRTFVFLHEILFLIENNLIKGGSLDNAIVFVTKPVSEEYLQKLAKFFNKPEVKVLNEGVLNTIQLYYPDEAARHKLLDLVGDMALLGCRFNGKITGMRPGHKANTEFCRKLL
jgi:UDP-3-O-[3-hydroxymyristoyl] N-acetylglucosamine deacetylase/3-hydroxyacyl-[acyl-carrier-protein] dehydratase